MQSSADTIYIHTDTLQDFNALKSKNIKYNLDVASNLYALKTQSTDIKFEYMETKQSLLLMDKGESICIMNRIKTINRLEKYLFSQPVNLYLSRRLYQNNSYPPVDVNELEGGRVLLSDLFIKRPKAKVIISGQISYGDDLDTQLAKLSEINKMTRYSNEQDIGLIAMFAKGRAEFALLYPHQVYESNIKVKGRTYSIDSVPPYILGHLMCTKNNHSKSFIKSINNHLSTPPNLDELLKIHLSYINPIDQLEVKSYFHKTFH